VADGVSINDPAFAALAYGLACTARWGPLEPVICEGSSDQDGGFEPQYGKATGGIIQLVTKSGGTKFFGTVAAISTRVACKHVSERRRSQICRTEQGGPPPGQRQL